MSEKVAILGGGLAGLSAAWKLAQAGFEVDVLPITTEIVRVMKRVGVLESHLNQEKAYEALKELLAPKRTYAFFHLVNEHADRVCHARAPDCPACPVNHLCDKYTGELNRQKEGGGKES